MSNAIMVIKPYWGSGTWVFDDESVGLVKEPFVCGMPEMIDYMLKFQANIPKSEAKKGFRMLFWRS
jgi:hypothetical protein